VRESQFPKLGSNDATADTRDAMHAYARVLGNCLKACRSKRKHWWHASLRPSLNGLTTGIVRAAADFEIELDFRRAELRARASNDSGFDVGLSGQPASEIAALVGDFMLTNDVGDFNEDIPVADWPNFSASQSESMGKVLRSVATAMETFRAGIREETSPIQLWPHHFDLSMIWLPGDKIPGQDPADEEYSDKQMNLATRVYPSRIFMSQRIRRRMRCLQCHCQQDQSGGRTDLTVLF